MGFFSASFGCAQTHAQLITKKSKQRGKVLLSILLCAQAPEYER
jgi:hypothetical protein